MAAMSSFADSFARDIFRYGPCHEDPMADSFRTSDAVAKRATAYLEHFWDSLNMHMTRHGLADLVLDNIHEFLGGWSCTWYRQDGDGRTAFEWFAVGTGEATLILRDGTRQLRSNVGPGFLWKKCRDIQPSVRWNANVT